MASGTRPETAAPPRRRPPWALFVAGGLVAAVAGVVASDLRKRSVQPESPAPAAEAALAPPITHEVAVRKPAGPPVVKAGYSDAKGQPVTIACATCHTTKPSNPEAKVGTDLRLFHQGLKGAHGSLACVACHNPSEGYGALRLADGRSLPYTEVMQLCAQCHGPQYRDYQHGAHGGMAGHWDLASGGRVRNNCVDCHDPHSPKYPTVRPAPGPRDRGTQSGGHGHE